MIDRKFASMLIPVALALADVTSAQQAPKNAVIATAAETAATPVPTAFNAAEPDPLLLPGDAAPPPMSVMLRPPGGPSAGSPPARTGQPPGPPVGIPMTLALEAARAALAACADEGLRVGVAVVDSTGQLLLGLQGDGAPPGRIYVAARKAYAAASFGVPTSSIQSQLRSNDPDAQARLKANMVVFPGGVPLLVDGKVVAAIAVSGARGDQDERCASAGAASIKEKLVTMSR